MQPGGDRVASRSSLASAYSSVGASFPPSLVPAFEAVIRGLRFEAFNNAFSGDEGSSGDGGGATGKEEEEEEEECLDTIAFGIKTIRMSAMLEALLKRVVTLTDNTAQARSRPTLVSSHALPPCLNQLDQRA